VMKQSQFIWDQIVSLPIVENSNHIGIYADMQNEVLTLPLFGMLFQQQKKIYFPKVYPKEKQMRFFEVSDLKQLVIGTFGVLEPPETLEAPRLDLTIVPGLAFDESGNRLGYGAGYYDRFFEKNRSVYRIGVCFEFQRVTELPVSLYDIPMDLVITEKNTYPILK